MIYRLFILFFASFMASGAFGQVSGPGSKFIVEGEVVGKDTGFVTLWYTDGNDLGAKDTVALNKGRFRFSGTVNRACEAILWTDMRARYFDHPTSLRFLLAPGDLFISFKINGSVTSGSKLQQEKERWDEKRAVWLSARRRISDTLGDPKTIGKGVDSATAANRMNSLSKRWDSIGRIIRALDVGYIRSHPDSYLSGYLLDQQKRHFSTDTIEAYYSTFASDIKKSTLGHEVLEYVYPLTDDKEFRKANPLIDNELERQLDTIHSVYALRLTDVSGRVVELSAFKNKYVVIDFWASWCGPCLANVPYLNKLIKSYGGDSIGFVSISVDSDLKKWEKAIMDYKIEGVQLCDSNAFNGVAAIYCKTIYVPHYVIADKNGRIINYNAPQAIEPALKKLLDGLLNEKGVGATSGR
jgi:thiol-disulfide isomerase/thioredoxin